MNYDKFILNTLKLYDKIKPNNSERSYTVLASINDAKTGSIIALATGTQAGLKVYPDDIEDCHAESLVKRAFKRYILDRLLETSDICKTVKQLNSLELLLFISQSPCGLIERYQGKQLRDAATGHIIERKPGRGQERDGQIVYVQRSNCLNKLKRWISSEGFQGKRLRQTLGIHCNLSHLIIGDCESHDGIDYDTLIKEITDKLNLNRHNVLCELNRMRRDDLVFDVASKQPNPVSVVWWHQIERPEIVVNGRKMGLTKRQCQNNNFKLKISDYWLKKDMERMPENSIQYL